MLQDNTNTERESASELTPLAEANPAYYQPGNDKAAACWAWVATIVNLVFLGWYLWLYRRLMGLLGFNRRAIAGPRWRNRLFGILTDERIDMLGENVTTSVGLRSIYGAPMYFAKRIVTGFLNRFRIKIAKGILTKLVDCQAVYNRLILARKMAYDGLVRLYQQGCREIGVAVLAAGAAEDMLKAVQDFLANYPDATVEIELVDVDKMALLNGLALAKEYGLDNVRAAYDENGRGMKLQEWITLQIKSRRRFDLLEMVGFLDYRPTDKFISLCLTIKKVVAPGGYFLSAHIGPSGQELITSTIQNWPKLIRRTPDVFRSLMEESGWNCPEDLYETEPMGVHTVCLCRN